MQTTYANSTPSAEHASRRGHKGLKRRLLGAALVLSLTWLPAQNAAALSTTVNDQLGARAMTVCMLEGGRVRKNGDQVICCVDRFCVACKDDEDCRVWTNKKPKLDSRLPRPAHSGASTNAPDPVVAPSPKDPDRGTAPEGGVAAPAAERRDHRTTAPEAGVVHQPGASTIR